MRSANMPASISIPITAITVTGRNINTALKHIVRPLSYDSPPETEHVPVGPDYLPYNDLIRVAWLEIEHATVARIRVKNRSMSIGSSAVISNALSVITVSCVCIRMFFNE